MERMEMERTIAALVDEIKGIADSEGIPVMGLGPCGEMEDEPPGHRPSDLLPGARSMICFGIPVPRGSYEASVHREEMIWRTQNLYYRHLDTLSLRFAALMEEHGARAVPIFACYPMTVNVRGDVVGYVNQIRMGELTGIGKMGRNGLLLNSSYGARMMLGGVLATIELPVIRPDVVEPGCPPGCRICVDSCPPRAIRDAGGVDIMRCLAYTAITPFMSRPRFALLTRFRRAAAARMLNLRTFEEHTLHICSRCITECPY
jgi:epoxyqueuosine reductase QueG